MKIMQKKTFWMNAILAVLATLGCFIFFFLNIDYVEARPSEKILNILTLVTPILTMVTLYKGNLQKLSVIFNILILFILALFTLRAIYHYPDYSIITGLIWMTPFIINVKQLRQLNAVQKA